MFLGAPHSELGKSRYYITGCLRTDRTAWLKTKEKPRLIGFNLIPVNVKSDSGASLFYSLILITDVQLSIIITLLAEHPVQIHQICQNLWTWFPIMKDLCSAKWQGIKITRVSQIILSINADLISRLRKFEVRKRSSVLSCSYYVCMYGSWGTWLVTVDVCHSACYSKEDWWVMSDETVHGMNVTAALAKNVKLY